ncbi:MAG: energy-coupling factor transporter transmembrane component T family protein [Ruminococcus sp.]
MLKDITLGQYFPVDSIIHRLDPRYKIVMIMIYMIMIFSGDSVICLAIGFVYTALAVALTKISLKVYFKSIKPVFPFLLFTALLNILFIRDGDIYFQWQFIKITSEGINTSIFMIVRIILLLAGTSVLTYSTSPIVLTDAIERLLSPLKKIKFPVHELAMMMSIALKFIPVLIEETNKIISAQKARGAELDSGNIIAKAKSLIPILVPLLISSFRRAEELATAMECRCYNGGEGRTRLRQMKSGKADYIALSVTVFFLVLTMTVNIKLK